MPKHACDVLSGSSTILYSEKTQLRVTVFVLLLAKCATLAMSWLRQDSDKQSGMAEDFPKTPFKTAGVPKIFFWNENFA